MANEMIVYVFRGEAIESVCQHIAFVFDESTHRKQYVHSETKSLGDVTIYQMICQSVHRALKCSGIGYHSRRLARAKASG